MSVTSTRISSLLLLAAATAACSGGGGAGDAGEQRTDTPQQRVQPQRSLAIPCARGGAGFANDCTVEQMATPRGTVLTVRHRDGAFRRLLVTADGRGVIAADGAQPARVTVAAGGIEVAVAADRYRLPATVRPGTARP